MTWGDSCLGGDSSSVGGRLEQDVIAVQGNRSAFAALRRIRKLDSPRGTPSVEDAPLQNHRAGPTDDAATRTVLYGEDLSFAASGDTEKCVASSDPCTGQSALTRGKRPPTVATLKRNTIPYQTKVAFGLSHRI